jgi:hypothetical protein
MHIEDMASSDIVFEHKAKSFSSHLSSGMLGGKIKASTKTMP